MNANFTRRMFAYIIDIIFLGAIILLIYQLIPESKTVLNLQKDIALLNEEYLNKQIMTGKYLNLYSIFMYDLDKERIIFLLVNFISIFLYFVILPLITKGQTIGKYLVRIKIHTEKEKLSLLPLIIRNLIVSGLGYLILSAIALFLIPKKMYLITISILGFIQFGLVITSIFMIIYSKERRGIEDILSNTTVIKK